MPKSVIVVGAGMCGVSSALALRRRGFTVTLLEKSRLLDPSATSVDASRLVRADYGEDLLLTQLGLKAIEAWKKFNQQCNEPVFRQSGVLFLTQKPLQEQDFESQCIKSLAQCSVQVQRLSGSEAIQARFPFFKDGSFQDGYFNPVDGWVDAQRALQLMLDLARKEGVLIHANCKVDRLLESTSPLSQSSYSGVVCGDRTFYADTVVLCAGAWVSDLVPELKNVLKPVSQALIYLKPSAAQVYGHHLTQLPPFSLDISKTGFYGFCLDDTGMIKVGCHGPTVPGVNHPDEARKLDHWSEKNIVSFIRENMPCLNAAEVHKTHVCFYCDTPDLDFWIDRHPLMGNVWIASACSGHGFKFAPVLGDIVADAVTGVDTPYTSRFRTRNTAAIVADGSRLSQLPVAKSKL